jgi:hypothetical protein
MSGPYYTEAARALFSGADLAAYERAADAAVKRAFDRLYLKVRP